MVEKVELVRLTSHVSHLTFHISRFTSHISRLTFLLKLKKI